MFLYILQLFYVYSPNRINDVGEECFTVDRGVAQGSPLSPTLYNMFMDTFAELLDTTPARAPKEPWKMFADDVKLSTVNEKGLQRLL